MEKLVFSSLSDSSVLSSLYCGIDEMDEYIHSSLQMSIDARFCKAYSVSLNREIVAFFALNYDSLELDVQAAYDLLHKEHAPIDIDLKYEEIFKEKQSYPALEISYIAVSKDFQRKDIGTRIVDEVFQMVRERAIAGCQFVTVMAYDKVRYSAKGFYQKLGFNEIGRGSADTIRMYRPVYTLPDDYFIV